MVETLKQQQIYPKQLWQPKGVGQQSEMIQAAWSNNLLLVIWAVVAAREHVRAMSWLHWEVLKLPSTTACSSSSDKRVNAEV